jgi:hypothetical protein
VRDVVTYLGDIAEHLLAKVDYVLDKFFNGVAFIVVRQTFVSTQLTECRRKALRVSVEGCELRGTFLFIFVRALLLRSWNPRRIRLYARRSS